jgi:hypothetical protein
MTQKKHQYQTPVLLWTSEWIQTGTQTVMTKDGSQMEIPLLKLAGILNLDHQMARALIKNDKVTAGTEFSNSKI